MLIKPPKNRRETKREYKYVLRLCGKRSKGTCDMKAEGRLEVPQGRERICEENLLTYMVSKNAIVIPRILHSDFLNE